MSSSARRRSNLFVLAEFLLPLGLLLSSGCFDAASIPLSSTPFLPAEAATPAPEGAGIVVLPKPVFKGAISVEEALLKRRSVRAFANVPLTLAEVSQLLWAAQGTTSESGGRTAPSAGALYPLEVYVAAGNVQGLAPAIYKYRPGEHVLVKIKDGDIRADLADAAVGQSCVKDGAIDVVVAAVYERTTKKYGERGIRYVHMEAGHAAENICLQASALGLGVVTVGAFYDERVEASVGMPDNELPLYVVPVGRVP